MQSWKDFEKGVEVRPAFGNQINICYTGLLSKSGADQVFLHCGYSDPQNWRDTTTMSMERTPRGWEKNVPMKDHTMAFCFKDSANNWDNNSGYNWIARI
ncbi:carbohydrate-binding protein [Desulfoscipio geothermicus]|uniref:Starch/carbohydrate-binding module (Family 53) n=1 Tax=Desulfoscipio geothermicus DSM 3669 TaxID=1121426 RepID=A0A1I6CP63_9FIRM|nr:carbohydrate-binding protein [Desulfoscipio geothermicus]SFQ94947.1 Starch/carbohydrate-binding module (family 53) [Desulfoscipio geothermicus DSM 3669]